MDEIQTRVVRLAPGGSYELQEYSWSSPGRRDYKSEGFRIECVVDREGREHNLEWADEPRDITPGRTATTDGHRRRLRISSVVCPIRVLHLHWSQYSGSHPDRNSSWRTRTWHQFEIEPPGDE